MPSPQEQVAEALSGASTRESYYAGGAICWQHWPAQSGAGAVPLVLVHGGFGSWNHWIANAPSLCTHRDVWALDLPGLGRSGDMPEPHTTAHFAQLVLAGIDQVLGAETAFALAAFSFGAMISGHVAALSGPRCTRCTLIGASGFGELHVQAELLPPPGPQVPDQEAAAIHRENLARLMIADRSRIDELAVYLHGDNLARHRFRSRRLAGSSDLADVLPDIEARLVGLWGDLDATAGGAQAIELRRKLLRSAQADAEFYVLAGVGHWAMYEAPNEVNAILSGDIEA
ncbi:MAG: alpha/beta fold hydrolase [Pseudomonadota bacterium]